MKKVLIVLATVCLIAACSSTSPEEVAKKFVENVAQQKFDEAKKLATPGTCELLDMARGLGDVFGGKKVEPDFDYKFKLVNKVKEDDKYIITYLNEKEEEQKLTVIKMEGEWKVDASKDQ
ncbi:DUF4878 domain-containing protein [Marinilabiliaceae bacterium JC017]|nr:DUF4878 domain-containing protein [Marinilabiliaceae bacterium JC017]